MRRPLWWQHGLSLLEVTLALAIGAIFVVWQLQQHSEGLKEQYLRNESAWLAGVSSDLLQELANTGSYAGVSNLTLGQLRSVPGAYLKKSPGVTEVSNGFGGNVDLKPLTLNAAGDAYVLSYSSVPQHSCARLLVFLEQVHSAMNGVSLYAIYGAKSNGKSLTNLEDAFAWGADKALVRTTNLVGSSTETNVTLSALKSSPDGGLDLSLVGSFCAKTGTDPEPNRLLLLIRTK